jgi:hypothetical protein
MGTIYNLEYEYSTQNGQSLVFTKKDNSDLTPSDLHAVQLKMIQSNQIPHMLPLALEHIDLVAKLHYDIKSKQKLVTYLRDNKTTMNDYYQLFLSIINTLEDASSYMLEQNQYILKMEFLYVGTHANDVYLTYLPIKDVEKDTTVTEDLKQLLTDVAGEIEGLQGNEFKSILNYIKQSSFSLPGLKKLLLELISLRSNVYQQQYAHPDTQQTTESYQKTGQEENYRTEGQQSSSNQPIVAGSENAKKQKKKRNLPPLTSRERLYLILGSVLLLAMSWKLFEMSPTNGMLILSSLLSIVIVAGAVTYWKFWRPGVKPVETEETEQTEEPKKTEKAKQPKVAYEQSTPQAFRQEAQPEPVQPVFHPEPQRAPLQPAFAAEAAFAMDTTLLNVDHDDTVLLEEEPEVGDVSAIKVENFPVLTRESEGEESIPVEVDQQNFIIGRNDEAVSYVETAVGVSRIHVEIVKINDESYGVKDLGSKNGSKLNGNPMVPYKLYALNENDELTLGRAQYVFNWSNPQ